MVTPLFKPTSCSVDLLVSNIDHGSLGLPDIQRPFVWSNAQVRDLFDSMFKGYPVGFLLFWVAPDNTKEKQIGDMSHNTDTASLLIIDGQQRLTSLYAVMKGKSVVDKNFQSRTINIAFNPLTTEFSVKTAIIARDPQWIADISELFTNSSNSFRHINYYLTRLKEAGKEVSEQEEEIISGNIERLLGIKSYAFSALEIDKTADEELVADIFVRVNSGGQKLNQSDFILTLMSVFWDEGRTQLETFCRQCLVPSNGNTVTPFNYFIKPDPSDLLRVSIGIAFRRARLKYGYQVLRGKNLDTGEITTEKRETQFELFQQAQAKVLNLQNWKDFMRCLYAAGYRSESMITSSTGVMYAYIFYLIGKYDFNLHTDKLYTLIARWFFMSALTSRYSSSPESMMEEDLANLRGLKNAEDFVQALDKVIQDQLTEDFWKVTLPNKLAVAASRSPALSSYYAALILLDANVLFSKLKVSDMLDMVMKGHRNALEKHHLFPKAYLSKIGFDDDRDRNQIANFALIEWDRNNIISDEAPEIYFPKQIASIKDKSSLQEDLRLHALPDGWEKMPYKDFLEIRCGLIAQIVCEGFSKLNS